MPKHIRVLAKIILPAAEYVDLTVVDVSHLGLQFGGNFHGLPLNVWCHKRVRIRCKETPIFMDFTKQGIGRIRHDLHLTIGKEPIGKTIRVPATLYGEIKEALEAYNIWGQEK